MSDNIWVQLNTMESVSDEERDRVLAAQGAKLSFELPADVRPSVVLVDALTDVGDRVDPTMVTVYDALTFRRVYGLDLHREGKLAAVRRWGASTAASYYRWPAILAILSGAETEEERATLAALANEVCADLESGDRDLAGGALALAMQGLPALALAGASEVLDPATDLEIARWLAADPSRVPNLTHVRVKGDDAQQMLALLNALEGRPCELMTFFSDCQIDNEALFSAIPSTVRGLDFTYCKRGAAFFDALASSRLWPALERALLHNNDGKARGLKALIAAPKTTPIRALDVGYNHLKPADFAALAKAAWLDGIERLAVKYNDGLAKGAKALLSSKKLSGLKHLDFGANEIGDAGLEALCENKSITKLESLVIEGNSVEPLIGPAGARALASWEAGSSIRAINLGQNHIGDEGFVALVTSQNLRSLQKLDVQYNNITPSAFEQLAGVETAVRPKVVSLSGNKIGSAGYGSKPKGPKKRTAKSPASPWSEALWLTECIDLNLYNTELDADVMAAIVASPQLAKLRNLNLSSNYGLGTKALEYLCAQPLVAQLEVLEILYWKLSAGAGALLAEAPFAKTIQHLSVSKEGLTDEEQAQLRKVYGTRMYLS
ncbi:MAG: hypothetical protein JNK05_18005 [Myxococcales bacterium]|nr:hypothetical protein [Myxococcales bacterium]